MQVSRSGFYAWSKRAPSARQKANEALTEKVKEAFQESKETYGSPRIYVKLKGQGIVCSEKRVARLMRAAHLKAGVKSKFVVTTDSRHDLPIAENALDRRFSPTAPNTHWAGDIAYIWTAEGWFYLAVILDLFSRRIVGWAMDKTIDRSLVVAALSMAVENRRPEAGLLCHSDRGSQYASGDYQKTLSAAGIVCSMSRKGNCWDNAPSESFFAGLKRELAYRTRFATRAEARASLFEWIEVWYNRKRLHSSLGYVSPATFESRYQQQQERLIEA